MKTNMRSQVQLTSKSPIRRDIQGLRALAVVVVISDHLFEWPLGGFVGVDVFFVLSGFLITSLLLREEQRSGTISFARFYKRRIKRIMPAAVLVLAATVLAGFVVFNTGRAVQTLVDSIWALFFGANWHFAAIGTDYFTADAALSPVQHFWSLSVEEQFYFVWPWLMLAIFALTTRFAGGHRSVARWAIGSVMILLVVTSFSWSIYETASSPTWSYFSTFSRAWELGAGALIAVFASSFEKIPNAVRPFLAWFGILVVVGSVVFVTDDLPFPGPFALFPVLGTVVIVVAGTGGRQSHIGPLTNRVSGYLGDISYSLYLWHFPVIIFASVLAPAGSVGFYVLTLFAIFATSVLAYELVENPIRRSAWLESGQAIRASRLARRNSYQSGITRAGRFALGGLALLSISLSVVALGVASPRSVANEVGDGADYFAGAEEDAPAEALTPHQIKIEDSIGLTEWPVLVPGLDTLTQSQVPEWKSDGCLNTDESSGSRCTYGEGEKLAVLLGDSVAISYMPAIRAALSEKGWRVQSLTLGECPAIFIGVMQGGVPHSKCDEHHAWVEQTLRDEQPDLIIMSSAENSLQRLASGAEGDAAIAEWSAAAEATLTKVAPLAPRTVLLAPPPQGKKLAECATNLNGPSDCTATIQPRWERMTEVERVATTTLADPSADANFIDTRDWFCNAKGVCPAIYGTTPMRVDANHLTGEYSNLLGPEMATALLDGA